MMRKAVGKGDLSGELSMESSGNTVDSRLQSAAVQAILSASIEVRKDYLS